MGSCRASQEKGGSPMEMEASNSRGREGEARRVNVVYFLSRNGRVEHPHLLRVHRLHRDRVHLRDVKQWLLEFRGNQVSNSFSWSYKRRYRGGYVWQDLRDDDLITPFSDNEYILKGSNDLLALNPPGTPSKLTMPAETHEKPAVVGEALPPSAMLPPPPEQAGEISSDEPKHGEDGKQQRRKEEDDEDTKAASLVSDSNDCSKRVGQVLCNILGCKTAAAAETADDALRPVSHR